VEGIVLKKIGHISSYIKIEFKGVRMPYFKVVDTIA